MNPIALWRAATLLQRIGVTLGLILAVIAGVKLWFHFHDKAVIDEHEAEVTAQVIEASASASIAAVESAAATKSKVEKQNDDARKAADGCADVLKCGLDRMRERTR